MPIQKRTIEEQLKSLRKAYPRGDESTGQMYARASDTKRSYKKVTLFGLFVSDENTFLLRPHLFESKKARNPTAWEAWFAKEYGKILRDGILPGMENRTGKQWRLYRIIGWAANDRTGLARATASKTRNKTKPQRRKNGRNNTRRRQRNVSR